MMIQEKLTKVLMCATADSLPTIESSRAIPWWKWPEFKNLLVRCDKFANSDLPGTRLDKTKKENHKLLKQLHNQHLKDEASSVN